LIVTRGWASVLALLILAGLVGVAHLVVVASNHGEPSANSQEGKTGTSDASARVRTRRRGVKGLVIGTDGRASTSKLQVLLWTFAVFYAFVFLLLWGRSTRCGDAALQETSACVAAANARSTFSRTVNGDLQPEYYVLLGFPLAAALAAKSLTATKVASGAIHKPPITENQEGVVQGLSEVMSNDRGETDLMDFQYFAFNLLSLAFFYVEFLTRPSGGLPDLPPTLLALSGVSTAVYTTKKALEGGGVPMAQAPPPSSCGIAREYTRPRQPGRCDNRPRHGRHQRRHSRHS